MDTPKKRGRTKFVDSYGRIVRDGDTVLIEQTYGRRVIEGKKASVSWDGERGMFRFSITDLVYGDNFNGIHKFKLIKHT